MLQVSGGGTSPVPIMIVHAAGTEARRDRRAAHRAGVAGGAHRGTSADALPRLHPCGSDDAGRAHDRGRLIIAVETERAPVTAANFLKYVDQKRLDGIAFYRAMNLAPGYGLVQFGTRNDPKRTLPGIAHEPTSKTGLSHVDGAISMAMAKPGTAAGDFFVVIGDIKSMDATLTIWASRCSAAWWRGWT
ncbi:peptidylprolyl isomerase [Sphingomonas sp. MMS24-JH45]